MVGAFVALARPLLTILVVLSGPTEFLADGRTGADDVDDAALFDGSVGEEMTGGAIALLSARIVDVAGLVTRVHVGLRCPEIAPERAFDMGKVVELVTERMQFQWLFAGPNGNGDVHAVVVDFCTQTSGHPLLTFLVERPRGPLGSQAELADVVFVMDGVRGVCPREVERLVGLERTRNDVTEEFSVESTLPARILDRSECVVRERIVRERIVRERVIRERVVRERIVRERIVRERVVRDERAFLAINSVSIVLRWFCAAANHCRQTDRNQQRAP